MNLFWQELRKIWRPGILAALAVLGAAYYYIRPAFYIEYFNNGPQSQAAFDLALDWVARYGPTMEPDEREEIGRQLEEAEALFASCAADSPEMAARGIMDYDSFEAFRHDVYSGGDEAYEAAKERGDIALLDRVIYGEESNYFTVQELRRFLEAYDGEALPDPAEVEVGWADSPRLDEKCRERVRAMRADRTGRSVLPEGDVQFSAGVYVKYLALWCMVSAVLLLSPVLVRDRLHRMREAQWASRCGRRILHTQLAAAMVSGLLLTLLNIALYSVPFALTRALAFWNCSLHSVFRTYPWFDWTYGQYLLALLGLTLALALGASALTVFLSQYSGNYVAMLLKAIPLIVVLAVFGVLVMDDPFYFSNALSRFLVLPGGEFAGAAVLALLGLGLCFLACRRQGRRELV